MAITPTAITSEEQIYLTNSPVNLRIRNLNNDSNIKSVVCELYIWSGALNAPPSTASYTLVADKVSKFDDYINFQISEILRSHITGTKFAWSPGDEAPSVSGEGVFWQFKYQVTNENLSVENAYESLTNFATLGYRYDFEQVGDIASSFDGQPYLGLEPIDYTNRKFTDRIQYFKREFDFTKLVSNATSENIIKSTLVTPTETFCQLGDKYLIVYLNRHGLWDYFTPYGRAVKTVRLDTSVNNRLYRNPNSVNNNVNHSRNRIINDSPVTITINTGDLNEKMTAQVEEVIYSPLIYLIEFEGDIFTTSLVGITVDSTTVTVDNTVITVDSDSVTSEDIGFFATFKQIPVVGQTKDFIKKTRLNDKGKINYDLIFDTTVGRLNDLR